MKKKVLKYQDFVDRINGLHSEIWKLEARLALAYLVMESKECILQKKEMNPEWVLRMARLEL